MTPPLDSAPQGFAEVPFGDTGPARPTLGPQSAVWDDRLGDIRNADTPATTESAPEGFAAVPFGGDLPEGVTAAANKSGPDSFAANFTAPINRTVARAIGGLGALVGPGLGLPKGALPSSSDVMNAMPGVGIHNPDAVQQNGAAGRIGKVSGETTDTVLQMLGGGAAAGPAITAGKALLSQAPKAGSAINTLLHVAPDMVALSLEAGVIAPTALAAGQGAAGGAAEELVPDRLKPTANLIGQTATALPLALTALGRKAAGIVADGAKTAFAPFNSGPKAAEKAATEQLRAKLGESGTAGTVDAIEHEGGELVPGSQPNLAAVTQNPGVSQLTVARQDTSPDFLARKDAQAAAQKQAIEGIAPADASAEALPTALEQQRADRAAKGQSSIDMAQDVGEEATQAARDAQAAKLATVSEQTAATTAKAAQARDEALAGTGVSDASNQELGAQQRAELQGARKPVASAASAKFQAVDPEGKLHVDIPIARETVAKTIADMGEADTLSPEEERLYGLLQRASVKRYKDVQSIDAALGNAVRAARANPLEANAARRMGEVQSALRQDVVGATGLSPAEIEAEMAARGVPPHPAPKDMAAVSEPAAGKAGEVALDRAGQSQPEGENQALIVNVGPRNERGFEGSGGEGPGGANALDAGKPTDVGSSAGESGVGNRGPRSVAEGQGAPGGGAQANGATEGPVASNFPPEALDRWLDAKAAWRALKETFDRGPVGRILAKGGNGEPYKVSDSSVMDAFWRGSGAKPEDVQAVTNALGGDAGKLKAAFAYIANDLRKSAVVPGTNELKPQAYARWLDKHGPALKMLDGLSDSPQLRQKFENLAGAQRALEETRSSGETALNTAKAETTANVRAVEKQAKTDVRDMSAEHQQAMDGWQKSYASQFIGDRDPQQGMQKILKSGLSSPPKLTEALTELGQRTAFDKDARAGLQKMISEEISRSLTDANGWIKPDTFRKFVANNQVGLRKVFSSEQLRSLDAVAADLERNANVERLAKVNPGPTTGARMGAQSEAKGGHGGNNTVLGVVLAEGAGRLLGHVLGPLGHVAGLAGGLVAQSVTGHKTALFESDKAKILDKMLLNPEFAKTMLMKYRPEAAPMIGKQLSRQLKRVGLTATLSSAQQN